MTTSDPRMAEYPHEFMGRPRMCVRCSEHEEGLLVEKFNCPVLMAKAPVTKELKLTDAQVDPTPAKRFLHVVFINGSNRWYEIDTTGWKLDAMTRELIVGKGVGRKHIPLDNVEYYSPE